LFLFTINQEQGLNIVAAAARRLEAADTMLGFFSQIGEFFTAKASEATVTGQSFL